MSEDTFVRYEPCPDCGSKDNVGVWRTPEGREKRYCFSCQSTVGAKPYKKITWPLRGYGHATIDWRKLTKETCIKYDVLKSGRIVAFPLYKNNKVVGVKYRDFMFNKSEKRMHMNIEGLYSDSFFGWNSVHTSKLIAIALGEFDALAVYQATGIPCLSPTNGDTSLVRCVKGDYEKLSTFEHIIFLPDRDKSNNATTQPSEAVAEAVNLLGKERCSIVSLSFDDPNEYLMECKSSLLKEAFWSAQPCTADFFYSSTSSLISPTQMGIITGLSPLDEKLQGLRAEEVTYVLGAPGQGKTTFVQYLIWCLANRGIRTCSIILEGGHRKFITKLANVFAGGNYYLCSQKQAAEVNAMMDEFVLAAKSGSGAKPETIKQHIKAACKVHDAKVVIVDNITAAGNTDNFFESTSEFVYMFDRLASELGVHFIVISHVGRAGYNEPPTLGAGLGSGMIERVGFNIIGVHRKRGDNKSRIEILKNREIGPPGEGVFNLHFDLTTCRYTGVAYEYASERS